MNIQQMLLAAKQKQQAEATGQPAGGQANAPELSSVQAPAPAPAVKANPLVAPKPAVNLAPQKAASVMPSINAEKFMNSAKELAGMAAAVTPKTPEQQAEITAMSHEQIKANIEKMKDALLRNDPLLPNYLVMIKRILNENEQLIYELTEEEIGEISKGMYKASDIVIATKAVTSRAGKKTVTAADLL